MRLNSIALHHGFMKKKLDNLLDETLDYGKLVEKYDGKKERW